MSEINESKLIKKKYGEKMWHYCRSAFPSILETNGKLYEFLINNFAPSHKLYDNLVKTNQLNEFKNYVLAELVEYKDKVESDLEVLKTPSELLSDVGYALYECHSEEEIQAFKSFYAPGEELCTFSGGRLDSCHVFFAVRNDALALKREDFKEPKRQDEYGTSVISIQFSRDDDHSISIKNRYNHTVSNPDATFSNNLENIVPGLTASFEKYYGLKQQYHQEIDLDGFEFAQGRMYRYFYENNNIFYCEDNIIIDNGQIIEKYRDKGRYIFCGVLIYDKHDKKFIKYDPKIEEGLLETVQDALSIEVVELEDEKRIVFKYDGYDAVITLDDDNMIIGYYNPGIENIGDYFLHSCFRLQHLNVPNARIIGNNFGGVNQVERVYLPNVVVVGDNFFSKINTFTKVVDMPKLKVTNKNFCCSLKNVETVNFPSLEMAKEGFFNFKNNLRSVSLPSAKYLGHMALAGCKYLEDLYIPYVEEMSGGVLYRNKCLRVLNAPSLKKFGISLLHDNDVVESINAPMLEELPRMIRNEHVLRALGLESVEEFNNKHKTL